MFSITLTRGEKAHAEWALVPMAELVSEQASDPEPWDGERWYFETDLPRLEAGRMVFPKASMVVDDMLYRLTEQLRDMADGAGERYPRSAQTLADKIEAAALAAGWQRTMGHGWRQL